MKFRLPIVGLVLLVLFSLFFYPFTQEPIPNPIRPPLSESDSPRINENPPQIEDTAVVSTDGRKDARSSIKGSVVDAKGNAISGDQVLACSLELGIANGIQKYLGVWNGNPGSFCMEALTEIDGSFRMGDLLPGDYGVFVWGPSHVPIEIHTNLIPGENEIRLIAEHAGLGISGVTRDGTGSVIQGVTVTAVRSIPKAQFDLLGDYEKLRVQWIQEANFSGSDGRFALQGLAPGAYDLFASHPNLPPLWVRAVAAGTENLEIVFSKGANIFGQVQSEAGEPIPGANVALVQISLIGQQEASDNIFTIEEGRYQLAVPSGGIAAQILSSAPGFGDRILPIHPLEPGEHRQVDLLLSKAEILTGFVTDSSGAPLAGCSVRLTPICGNQASLREFGTDADGRFQVDSFVPKTPYELKVRKKGYETVTVRPIEKNEEIRVSLTPLLSIRGQLSSRDGRAEFPEFTVESYQENEHGSRNLLGPSAKFPAGNGSFFLEGVSRNLNGITVWADGFAPTQTWNFLPAELDANASEFALTIQLDPGQHVRGKIVDAVSGSAISGARILPLEPSRRNRWRFRTRLSGVSDPNGRFEWTGSSSAIRIEHAEYAPRTIPIPDQSGQTVDLGDIALTQGGSILLIAMDRDEKPLQGMQLRCRANSREWFELGFTDARGRIALDRFEPGVFDFTLSDFRNATATGASSSTQTGVSIEPGKTRQLVFRLEEKAYLGGLIHWEMLASNSFLPDALVILESEAVAANYTVSSLGDGSYRIRNIEPGTYIASVKSFNLPSRYTLSQRIEIRPGENRLDFQVRSSGLAGRVVATTSGQGIGSVRLEIAAAQGAYSGTTFQSLPDGTFGAVGLAPGAYRIQAKHPGYAEQWFGPFEVGKDKLTEGVQLALVPEGFLRVQARNRAGAGVPGAQLRLLDPPRALPADALGNARFDQLKAAGYLVQVQAPGYAPLTAGPFSVESDKETAAVVTLRRLCSLNIRVEKDGVLSTTPVTLQLVDQETGQAWPEAIVATGGVTAVADLPEGAWKVMASGELGAGEKLTEIAPDIANSITLSLN